MTNSLNKVILICNVGQDPIIKQSDGYKTFAVLNVATNEKWKDKQTGHDKDKTEWHKVVVYNDNLVKLVQNYVKKGSKLYIEGALHTKKFTDSSGLEKQQTEVVLQGFNGSILLLSSNKEKDLPF
jgi:single-strand DNA-binding protein